jgi:hypothetical protein
VSTAVAWAAWAAVTLIVAVLWLAVVELCCGAISHRWTGRHEPPAQPSPDEAAINRAVDEFAGELAAFEARRSRLRQELRP